MAIGDFSHLVTNALMKKVLADVAHINSTKLGNNYPITSQSHGACTSGPATWYGRAGIHLTFWNGAQPYTSTHKNYNKNKRSATVEDMKASLSKAGFQIVWSGTGQDANAKLASSGILRPGDVATMLSSNSAHAAMWTGLDWRSDFLQGNKPYPYSSAGRGGNETFILWRHPSFQDNLAQVKNNITNNTSNNASMTKKTNKKPKRINNFGGYPAWGKMYSDALKLMSDYGVDTNIVNLIILACIANGLSLNQTAVILGNAFLESHFNLNAKNNIKGGHQGLWQFSTRLYLLFGLQDWNKLLKYLMEEVAKTPDESAYVTKNGKKLNWYAPHKDGNGWKVRHKKVWDTSDNIELLSWAFGEGWERYGNPKADTDSRTQLSKLFRDYLINSNYAFKGQSTTRNLDTLYTQLLASLQDNTLIETKPIYGYLNLPTYLNNSQDDVVNLIDEYNDENLDYDLDSSFIYDFLKKNNKNDDFKVSYNADKNYIDYTKAFYSFINSPSSNLQKGGTIFNLGEEKGLNMFNLKGYNTSLFPIKPLMYRQIIERLFSSKKTPSETLYDVYQNLDKKENGGILKYKNGGRKRINWAPDYYIKDDDDPEFYTFVDDEEELKKNEKQKIKLKSLKKQIEDDIYYDAPSTRDPEDYEDNIYYGVNKGSNKEKNKTETFNEIYDDDKITIEPIILEPEDSDEDVNEEVVEEKDIEKTLQPEIENEDSTEDSTEDDTEDNILIADKENNVGITINDYRKQKENTQTEEKPLNRENIQTDNKRLDTSAPSIDKQPIANIELPPQKITDIANDDIETSSNTVYKPPVPEIKPKEVGPVEIPNVLNNPNYDTALILKDTKNLVNLAKDIIEKYGDNQNEKTNEEESLEEYRNRIRNSDFKLHTVKNGEDFVDIADMYGVDYEDLMTINDLKGKTTLHTGQTLKIPIGLTDNQKTDYEENQEDKIVNKLGLDTSTKSIASVDEPNIEVKPVLNILEKPYEVLDSPIIDDDVEYDINEIQLLNYKNYDVLNIDYDPDKNEDYVYPLLNLKPGQMAVYPAETIDKIYQSHLSDPKVLENIQNGNLGAIDNYDLWVLNKLYDIYSDSKIHPRQFGTTLYKLMKAYGNAIGQNKNDSFYNEYKNINNKYFGSEAYLQTLIDDFRQYLIDSGYDPLSAALFITDLPYYLDYLNEFIEEELLLPQLKKEVKALFEKLASKYQNINNYSQNTQSTGKYYGGFVSDIGDILLPNARENADVTKRWNYYKPIIDRAFEGKNLPEIFKYIPFITNLDNSYNDFSGAKGLDPGLSGIWQLAITPAKGIGLEVNSLVNESLDPVKSSEKAAEYLSKLYDTYKSEKLAIAAFLYGPNMISKAIRRAGNATGIEKPVYELVKKYFPNKKIAQLVDNIESMYRRLRNVTINQQQKHIDLVKVNDRINLEQIADVLNIPVEELRLYNPAFRESIIPGNIKEYTLTLPSGYGNTFYDNLYNILNYKKDYYASRDAVELGTRSPNDYNHRNITSSNAIKKSYKKTASRNSYRKSNKKRKRVYVNKS